MLVDALFYFTKKINSMIGSNENALFELNQVSIKDSEIYINGTRGIPCSFGSMTESNRWPFGNFIVDNLKTSRVGSLFTHISRYIIFLKLKLLYSSIEMDSRELSISTRPDAASGPIFTCTRSNSTSLCLKYDKLTFSFERRFY